MRAIMRFDLLLRWMYQLLCVNEAGVWESKRQRVVGYRQVAVVYRHMSTPNESTPLISTSVNADTPRRLLASEQADSNIEARSQAILTSLKADLGSPIQYNSEPVNLLVLLYASHRIRDFLKGSSYGDDSITSILVRERSKAGIRQRLDVEIGKILDIWGSGEVDDETLYEALWRRWEAGQGRVSGKSSIRDRMVLMASS
jgi:hypothetical protein